jgi:hypothetical protein
MIFRPILEGGWGRGGVTARVATSRRRRHANVVVMRAASRILPMLTCSSLHPHQPLTRPHLTVHSIFARVCAHPIDTRCLCACCAADVTRATRPGTMQHHAFFALWCASRFDSDARQFNHPPRLDDQHRHQQDPDTKQYKLTTSTSSRSREDYIMYIKAATNEIDKAIAAASEFPRALPRPLSQLSLPLSLSVRRRARSCQTTTMKIYLNDEEQRRASARARPASSRTSERAGEVDARARVSASE